MSSIDREAIWAGAFAYFKTKMTSSYKTMSRVHVTPPTLTDIQQPAFFLSQWAELREPKPRGLPGKLTLIGMAYIYATRSGVQPTLGQETPLAATALNALLKTFDDALAPDADGAFTLGGLASHCWIQGIVRMVEGNTGFQAMAQVPIHILVP